MAVASGDRDVCVAEKQLLERKLKIAAIRLRLYRIQANKAAERLSAADIELGRVRCLLRQHGFHRLLQPPVASDVHRAKQHSRRKFANY